ncbi:MAG: cupin domain-containing protein [Alphaproteobacteria bacterium]|nr:cupin domain-containing protein [Alphaproteobacteria bacterium]MBL6939814.1 cupin domain-containing protein [Alphaproteobacteria bacterium]MBL7098267.1 cupin domain-containing protein [Alphaproteobacteria bacterium]
MRMAAAAVMVLVMCCGALAADPPKVNVQPVTRTNTTVTGQPIAVPQNPDVIVSIATFPVGARLPEHQHPHPHYVYVLEGVLTVVNTETKKTFDVKAGDFVVEMQDTWHYGINNGTVPVKLLVIDQVPAGTPNNMKPKR